MSSCGSGKANKNKSSRWVNPIISPVQNPFISHISSIFSFCKKASPCLLSKEAAGSLTVEAALILPLFMFFIANVLSLFIMFEEYSINIAKLHDSACNMAMLAHLEPEGTGQEMIELDKSQPIHSVFKVLGFPSTHVVASAKARKWTGYDVTNGQSEKVEEEYVYITESGYAYHRSRTCSHLKVTVSTVSASEIGKYRNSSGGKYYPCERCGNGISSGVVFITNQGNKYHNSVTCSGLKRTIKTVKLSEVGGRGPCSACG